MLSGLVGAARLTERIDKLPRITDGSGGMGDVNISCANERACRPGQPEAEREHQQHGNADHKRQDFDKRSQGERANINETQD